MIGNVLANRYELTGLLADGPIFATYSARDRLQNRDVALRLVKAPFSRDGKFVARLRETVSRYSSLRGLNIEGIQELDDDGDDVFVVGELTRAPSLADRIRKLAPFSIQVAVGTGISICQALEVLHRTGTPHGDPNPANIAVFPDGDIRLQMTGIWEAYSGSTTAAAMVLPSMSPYLAPEVTGGEMPSPQSDVYAVGIVLYELLTSRLPYYGETTSAIAMQHATSPTPSVRDINPAVPPVLDEIVRKAMSKDAGSRYRHAGELLADLRTLQDALRFGRQLSWPLRPAAAVPGPSAPRPERRSGRVAPRMSALRKDEEEPEPTKQERDVPVWLVFITIFVGAVALSLVGVWLMFNLNKPRTVDVPSLRGLSVSEARDVLRDAQLTLRIASRRPNDTVEIDRVLESDPDAGEPVREGGQVSVVLSAGSRFVLVPDLAGMTIDKAKSVLSSLNLELDETVERVTNEKVSEGLVIRTSPASRTRVERQSRVRLIVSNGSLSGTDSVPGATEDGYLYTLKMDLSDLQEETTVRIELEDTDGPRIIHEEIHNTGDQFEESILGKGRKATFRIYYNGDLVRTIEKEADEGEAPSP
jgi:serine/threonine-protein kinase